MYTKLKDLARDFKQWNEINVSVFGPIMDSVFSGEYHRENGIYYISRENREHPEGHKPPSLWTASEPNLGR